MLKRAELSLELDNLDAAIHDYELIQQLDPNNVTARDALNVCLLVISFLFFKLTIFIYLNFIVKFVSNLQFRTKYARSNVIIFILFQKLYPKMEEKIHGE